VLFQSKPSELKPPAVKPSAKSSTPNPGLFASEEDPLFSGSKPKAVAVSINSAICLAIFYYFYNLPYNL
jgi:hypothetical protein